MARPVVSLENSKRNLSKAQITARQNAESQVAAMAPSKPKPTLTLSKEEKKVFNRFIKLNDNFNEADSTSLSILTRSLYRYSALSNALNDLDPLDEQCVSLERRIHAYDKAVVTHMNLLCIPLSQRLRMANDMAKISIEEKKLEQMGANEMKQVNPLLSLLEEDEDE
ncbi:hypothetical protein LIT25_23955 [Bacillus sp. F19]|nr:hypothetical protein LIT25_23955 [Bacillus sp. F19]